MNHMKQLPSRSEPVCWSDCWARGGSWVCFKGLRSLLTVLLLAAWFTMGKGVAALPPQAAFLAKHCFECHDQDSRKGGLDISSLNFQLENPVNHAIWVKVYDRVDEGEMPPKNRPKVEASERSPFLRLLGDALVAADNRRKDASGRATLRRLNRYEYENTLRDILGAPWLQLKEMLPEDGEAYRFNKTGEALDVSHVQMARYLSAADYALRESVAWQAEAPAQTPKRFYARDQRSFTGPMKFGVFNSRPERATFPVLGVDGQPDVRSGKAPISVGITNAALRELEAVGVVASAYEPIEPKFNEFQAKRPGKYRIRLNGFSVWVGPGKGDRWWIPDLDVVSRGRRNEPVALYAERKPHLLRRLGGFDVTPEASVHELEVYLLPGETLRPDATRLFRSRPPNWRNPLAEQTGQPGVAWRWMEVEGPLEAAWPPPSHQMLFADLPLREVEGGGVEVISNHPDRDMRRLLGHFVERACRGSGTRRDVEAALGVAQSALRSGESFKEAMLAAYSAVLCSPAFLYLQENRGALEPTPLAARLSYFLINSAPDEDLVRNAKGGALRRRSVLVSEAKRLLGSPESGRFVDGFLNYWLDLRKLELSSPDELLYPDYYLDDALVDSAGDETRQFFAELIARDLPVRNLVASRFAMLNERLAAHYGVRGVEGGRIRRVDLPSDSPRGGLLTQASVLKVTANGTTTSPVVRGAWVMERIFGKPPPPPPASVAAVDPDIRGAVTVRQQLEKHRNQASCAVCHEKMDPAGFALESFDVAGGWRTKYRVLGDGVKVVGFGKNGQAFEFRDGPPVDASGQLPGERTFQDIFGLKQWLMKEERQLARNLVRQLVVYSTGAPVRFGDRGEVEAVLDRASGSGYGVRSLILELVQSPLFRRK